MYIYMYMYRLNLAFTNNYYYTTYIQTDTRVHKVKRIPTDSASE